LLAPVLALALAAAAPACAQDAGDGGEAGGDAGRLRVLAGGAAQAAELSATGFDATWQRGVGGRVAVEGDWRAVTLTLGATGLRYRPARDTTAQEAAPGITALALTGGLGVRRALGAGLAVQAGAELGSTTFRFGGDAPPGLGLETELAAGLYARLGLALGGGWGVYAEGRATRTFFRDRLDLVTASVGLRRTLRAPAWLGDVLR
jgi:hypothetical protein